jgi:hypothetical protein
VRSVLKDDLRAAAIKRDEIGLKVAKWESGKQGEAARRVFMDNGGRWLWKVRLGNKHFDGTIH